MARYIDTAQVGNNQNRTIKKRTITKEGCILPKTGMTLAYNSGDDGDLERGAGVNWYLLEENNEFGNQQAYTGLTGGYYDADNDVYRDVLGEEVSKVQAFPNDVMLCWKNASCSGRKIFAVLMSPETDQKRNDHLTAGAKTHQGHDDWYVLNVLELISLFHWGKVSAWLNWQPLSLVANNNDLKVSSSTRQQSNRTMAYRGGTKFRDMGNQTCQVLYGRYYSFAELGI